jgi:hypothetical protein
LLDVVCTTTEGKQFISTTFTGNFETRYHETLKIRLICHSAPSAAWA